MGMWGLLVLEMEVQPLASNQEGSRGPDWRDLAEMIAAFEDQNHVRIEVCLTRWTTGDMPDLSASAKAWEPEADRRVAKPSAFVNVRCRAERVKTLAGLISYLLYRLDFQLAESAWGDATEDRA